MKLLYTGPLLDFSGFAHASRGGATMNYAATPQGVVDNFKSLSRSTTIYRGASADEVKAQSYNFFDGNVQDASEYVARTESSTGEVEDEESN